jgi:1,4-alpha-glucan branching enzyme
MMSRTKAPKPSNVAPVRYDASILSADDIFLFNAGKQYRLYQKLGSHIGTVNGEEGTFFAVWAPNARQVFVTGEFNGWNKSSHPLKAREQSGIWEGFIPGIAEGSLYKYYIVSRLHNYRVEKTDPQAFYYEIPPKTASVVKDLKYGWQDGEWMNTRSTHNTLGAPISVYELHTGSWRRVPEENNRPLTYLELATQLTDYVHKMGFTHVELMPLMEHPFGGSWGYQTTGYFAPTSRYGGPQDLMFLIDYLHRNNIGVILDWVPSHFPGDEHGLAFFDGTHLYEHADPSKGLHPDWDSCIFNYGRKEVQSFLISSAIFWLDYYHADGLRVDGVASMLYLDYSRKPGEWQPNRFGGRENLEALEFLRSLNEQVYLNYPGVQMIAEESTSWPMVSRPTYTGGLGFGMKWDMGWMHDTLRYFSIDPIFRKYHQNELTFRSLYAFYENFVLPLSHDEVVHGKGSLLSRMPGNDFEKLANLRLLFGYMYSQPGKKMLFMGGEFGQRREWNHDASLDWNLLAYKQHTGLQKWVADLNHLYRTEKALHELDFDQEGFRWMDCNDFEQSVIVYVRKGHSPGDEMIVVCNFTPVPRFNYRIGAPNAGEWVTVLNSDETYYGGSGCANTGKIETSEISFHNQPCSLVLTLPPLSTIFLKREPEILP